MRKKIYIYYTAIVILLFFTFGIYFYMFHGDLSEDSYIWSNFGNYINGLLTPLLTIFNIIIFIQLTTTISHQEEQRSEKALEHEKQLLLMQLRKQEIDTFVKQTNRIFDGNTKQERIETLRQISDYLSSFSKTGFKWFNIDDNGKTKRRIEFLSVNLRTMQYDIDAKVQSSEKVYDTIFDAKEEITNMLVEAALK